MHQIIQCSKELCMAALRILKMWLRICRAEGSLEWNITQVNKNVLPQQLTGFEQRDTMIVLDQHTVLSLKAITGKAGTTGHPYTSVSSKATHWLNVTGTCPDCPVNTKYRNDKEWISVYWMASVPIWSDIRHHQRYTKHLSQSPQLAALPSPRAPSSTYQPHSESSSNPEAFWTKGNLWVTHTLLTLSYS